jgi:putative addiction module killer protein
MTVRKTEEFQRWLLRLKDRTAQSRILVRIRRIEEHGHFGDVKPAAADVSELRIDYGPGYRVYFTRRGRVVVILLCGGDKRTQAQDIARAVKLSEATDDEAENC